MEILGAYMATNLRGESQQEACTRDIGTFARFLEVAALATGQVVNVAGVARDAGTVRPTLARCYEVLVDTLIGTWLPDWRSRARVKEVRRPKFHLFDTGVTRELLGRIRDPPKQAGRGTRFETYVLHELRAAISAQNLGGELRYWRTPAGTEVDFIWRRGKARVGIEVKAAQRWRREFGAPLAGLLAEGTLPTASAGC